MVAVIDHKLGLSAINADIFSGDKACLVRSQEQHHIGNVQRISHPAGGGEGVEILFYVLNRDCESSESPVIT